MSIYDERLAQEAFDTNAKDFTSFAAQAESLSGVYDQEDMVYRTAGHLVSNDRDLGEVLPALLEAEEHKPAGGVGLFVGSGGYHSLMPDLAAKHPVMIDQNIAVLEFSQLLTRTITQNQEQLLRIRNPELIGSLVMSKLFDQQSERIVQAIREMGDMRRVENKIFAEAERYQEIHWSNPDRLEVALRIAREVRPAYIATTLEGDSFIRAFGRLCEKHEQQITFANLTNVHEWIRDSDMSFLNRLPFAPDASILFSSGSNGFLSADFAYSLDEYLDTITTYKSRGESLLEPTPEI